MEAAVLNTVRGRYMHNHHIRAIKEAFPSVTATDIKLIAYILRNRRSLTQTEIPIGYTLWQRFMTGSKEQVDKHLAIKRTVESAMEHIPGLVIELSDYYFVPGENHGRSRNITACTFPPALTEILFDRDFDSVLLRKGMTDIISGKKKTPRHYHTEFLAEQELVFEWNQGAKPWQRAWLTFLNGQNIRRFSVNEADARQANALIAQMPREWQRVHAEYALDAHLQHAGQLYQYVEWSSRFYAIGQSLQTMQRDVRKALYPNAYDIDLKSAQASLLVAALPLPILQSLLEQGDSLWEALREDSKIGEGMPFSVVKGILKSGFYATAFGSNPDNLLCDAALSDPFGISGVTDWPAWIADATPRFVNTAIVSELLRERNLLYKQIEQGLPLTDFYGQTHQIVGDALIEHRVGPHHILSRLMHANEQFLLEPVRDIVLSSQDTDAAITVLSYQHDGCMLQFRREEDAMEYLPRMQVAVEARAKAYCVLTDLEWARCGIL